MENDEFIVKGFKITIIEKPQFGIVGFTRPVNLDGGMISSFIRELTENGQMKKLTETLQTNQQIWVCLSDIKCSEEKKYCKPCDLNCSGFQTRCTVCVEKTEKHNFSKFIDGELFTFDVPISKWADFEVNENQSPTELHQHDVYEIINETGYKWNSKIGLHFDNEHEWQPGKIMHFLLPVIKI